MRTFAEITAALAVHPSVPGFQTLSIFVNGTVSVLYRYGTVQFRGEPEFIAWLFPTASIQEAP